MAVPWMVSSGDVAMAMKANPELKTLDQTLAALGMNVGAGYQDDGRWATECNHKEDVDEFGYHHVSIFTGLTTHGPRYLGVARQDGEWKRFVDRFLELPLI